ncbi:NADP oxidoreductase coenzyme F420-dependent [Carnobacterium sp. 17-4]|uniref:NADPH-dependent F420 reductase n=1 Tax=Carnobacterium sp. (strain 17-4) TaxID=208596 RepID=UPI0002058AA3|nr:NAD(P)-binding domain-containing protein [Carnobacterium sp. 17-4]AEB28901.1 NADP oxidoreductase coenzyme F420-dependent [Carnobacterium sp. 17-4]
MKIGIIGAGPIGTNIAKKLVNNGHDVKIADTRGLDNMAGKEISGTHVTVEDVIKNIDILIISLPSHVMPNIRTIIDQVDKDVIVVDTSNYYPFRDSKIEDIENGMVESLWVSKQLGRPVIKAISNQLAHTLENKGTTEGTSGRIAMTVSGDDQLQKQLVMGLVNDLGFDSVDSGPLSESWRQQPGTPAYCTELTKDELIDALKKANKEKAPLLRDKVMENFSPDFTHSDIVNLNREIYNS